MRRVKGKLAAPFAPPLFLYLFLCCFFSFLKNQKEPEEEVAEEEDVGQLARQR